MIDTTAKAFFSAGVNAGDIVTIVSVSTVTSIVCFYALNRIGAVSNFVNVLAEEKELAGYFSEAKSKVAVTLDLFGEKATKAAEKAGVKKVISFSVDQNMPLITKIGYRFKTKDQNRQWMSDEKVVGWEEFIEGAVSFSDITYRKAPDTMALLAHTGGTTGTPKAVMMSDISMNYVADFYRQCFE